MNFRYQIEAVMKKRVPSSLHPKTRLPAPWKMLDMRSTRATFQYAYEVPLGYSVNDLLQEVDALSAACGAHVELTNRGGAVIVNVIVGNFPIEIAFTPDMLLLSEGRSILCGFDRAGAPVFHSFRVPHLLVAGMSGYGKTDFLRLLVFQLLHRFGERIAIDIIDGKGFSFLPFRGIPNIRIVRDLAGASTVISEAKSEMVKRSNVVWTSNDRNVTKEFQWRLVIIDELAQISPAAQITKENILLAKRTYSEMASIACVGREAGVGLVMATQRPDVHTIHPSVKANCEASIAFRVKTLTNSEIIIDRGGAEKLPIGRAGRGIYAGTTDRIFQTPYLGNDEKWFELLAPYRTEEIDLAIEKSRNTGTDFNLDYDASDLLD